MFTEYFSGDCTKACDAKAPADIRSACDEGSYQYCIASEANLQKPECIDFVNRVESTITEPNREGLLKVVPYNQKTLQDYQNGLSAVASAFCQKDINVASDYCTKTYPSMFKNADYTKRMDILFSGLVKIGANPKTTDKKFYLGGQDDKKSPIGIDAVNGFLKWKEDQIKSAYAKYTKVEKDDKNQSFIVPKDDKNPEAIFGFYVDPEYQDLRILYPKEFDAIDKAVKLGRRSLDDFGLIIAINASDVVRDKAYTLISNELANNKRAAEMDIIIGLIQSFIKNAETPGKGLSEDRRKEPDFIELKKIAEMLDILKKGGLCEKNPSDPKCNDLAKVGVLKYRGNDFAGDIKTYLNELKKDTICSTKNINKNFSTIFGPECSTIPFDNNDKTNIMQYCLSTEGKNLADCKKSPPTFIDMKWLKNMTDTEFDKNGKITKVRCDGKDGRFTPDECRKICETYPDVCKDDIKTKCINDEYRYNQSKNVVDAFQPQFREAYTSYPKYNESCSEYSCMYYVLMVIIFVLFVSIVRSSCSRPPIRTIRIMPINPSSIYTPINNQKI